jgi:hypothetical protein
MTAHATTDHPMRRLVSNRRGLLAGAAALVGAGLARLGAADRASAANEVIMGATNDYNGETTILTNEKTSVTGFAVYNQKIAIEGVGQRGGVGVRGSSNAGSGIDFGGNGFGVEGISGGGTGVYGGSTSGTGVYGISTSSYGVYAFSTTGKGVAGFSTTADAVSGSSAGGNGVSGASDSGIGVMGRSNRNYGVQGATGRSGYAGLVGVGTVAGSAGFYAVGTGGASAGTFQGNVIINGSLTVTGTYPKSAAVKKRDGTQVRMYCQESPEPWFEDFGTATLTNGQATVDLDPEFDEVVRGDDYRVFVTAIGDTGFLYVNRKGPHRFEVRSARGASASGSFDYRVVARRLDNVGKRLERVDIPTMAPIDTDQLTQPVRPPRREQ